jgi:hypothetical protein
MACPGFNNKFIKYLTASTSPFLARSSNFFSDAEFEKSLMEIESYSSHIN